MGNIEGKHGERLWIPEYRFGKCQYIKNGGRKRRVIEEAVHYSFDTKTLNAHIVPAANFDKCGELVEKIKEVRGKLADGAIAKGLLDPGCRGIGSRGSIRGDFDVKPSPVERCIVLNQEGFGYLLAFDRLYIDGGSAVHSILGELQYFRFRSKRHVNQTGGKKLLYPSSPDDSEFEYDRSNNTGHCVYNSKFTIYDDIEDILDEFSSFCKGLLVDFDKWEFFRPTKKEAQ